MKRFGLVFVLLICVFMIFPLTSTYDSYAVFETSASGACVIESSSGRVVFEKNADVKLPMASTTKIMTCITAIESGVNLDEMFVISDKAVGVVGTSLYLQKGESMTLKDLLYGLMLVSGNDASVAIGEFVGGTVEHFVDMMNFKAKKIGAFNTHFENTHGLDEEGHYTTAYDLALITNYALKNPIFAEIVSTKNIQITSDAGKVRYFKNKNKILSSLDGGNGVKTGFTDDAGRCLVSSCKRGDLQFVCVVLNCGPMFPESQELLEKAFCEYNLYDLTKNYNFANNIYVEEGRKEYVNIGTEKTFLYPLKEEEVSLINYEYSLKDSVLAPVKNGDTIGEIQIYLDKELIFSEKVYTMEDIDSKSLLQKVFDILKQW